MVMNLQIINDCAGTDSGLPTAGTDPGRRYHIEESHLLSLLFPGLTVIMQVTWQ